MTNEYTKIDTKMLNNFKNMEYVEMVNLCSDTFECLENVKELQIINCKGLIFLNI
jgi:hypothetical protein